MSTQMFLNLPVKDLSKTIEFFTKLGFKFNPQFTDENAACMIVGEDSFVILLMEKFFKTFVPKEIADTKKTTELTVAIALESRVDVDRMVETALKAGATASMEPSDQGFMYSKSFQDLDGHIWEIFWMDPNHIWQT
ncbi:MAG: glyoxalase/bleomycin resistance/extradiol dioxygenase family protein [Anaerolinea sp.]|nr:glyoxalase/bleomycin resistance/extradiol dioxygenase family protein [Anaerolinea sp.]